MDNTYNLLGLDGRDMSNFLCALGIFKCAYSSDKLSKMSWERVNKNIVPVINTSLQKEELFTIIEKTLKLVSQSIAVGGYGQKNIKSYLPDYRKKVEDSGSNVNFAYDIDWVFNLLSAYGVTSIGKAYSEDVPEYKPKKKSCEKEEMPNKCGNEGQMIISPDVVCKDPLLEKKSTKKEKSELDIVKIHGNKTSKLCIANGGSGQNMLSIFNESYVLFDKNNIYDSIFVGIQNTDDISGFGWGNGDVSYSHKVFQNGKMSPPFASAIINCCSFLGFSCFTSLPIGNSLTTIGFNENFFSWPLWNNKIDFWTIISLLSLPSIHSEKTNRNELFAAGISRVCRVERTLSNKNFCFSESRPV
jgi:hypothetical protein